MFIIAAITSIAFPLVLATDTSVVIGNDIQDEAVSLLQTRVRKSAASHWPDASQQGAEDVAPLADAELSIGLLQAVSDAAESLSAVGAVTGDVAHVRKLLALGQVDGFRDDVLRRAHEQSHMFDTRARRRALVAAVKALDSVVDAGQHGRAAHAILEMALQDSPQDLSVESRDLDTAAGASMKGLGVSQSSLKTRGSLLAHTEAEDVEMKVGSGEHKLGLLELDHIVHSLSEALEDVHEGGDTD